MALSTGDVLTKYYQYFITMNIQQVFNNIFY